MVRLIKCIFCGYEADIGLLKGHSVSCSGHPAVIALAEAKQDITTLVKEKAALYSQLDSAKKLQQLTFENELRLMRMHTEAKQENARLKKSLATFAEYHIRDAMEFYACLRDKYGADDPITQDIRGLLLKVKSALEQPNAALSGDTDGLERGEFIPGSKIPWSDVRPLRDPEQEKQDA
jgi:hypothetical protein